MLDPVDRRWPKLLSRACEGTLATVAFTPIADLARSVACGYEARVRLPVSGEDTSSWWAAASQHGFGGRFGAALLTSALARREELPANCLMAVTVGASALTSREVLRALGQAGDLSTLLIHLDAVDETIDPTGLRSALERVRAQGALVALPATGPGRAGIELIAELSPQFVTVGRELVKGIDRDPRRSAALAGLGALASDLDAWLLARDVGTVAELGRLREMRVPLAQGPIIGAERELMIGLSERTHQLLRDWSDRRPDDLSELTEPVRTLSVRPQLVSERCVVIDASGRPTEVVLPHPGGRPSAHPALRVLRLDRPREVALRAAARPAEDQLAPVCVVDELGRVEGIVRVEVLLGLLARQS
jgi:EAL domain-containing protein (putative c-di-GMP-specific phosphodiesterase class I)